MANEHPNATMCSLAALPDVPGLSSRSDLNGLSGTTDGSMQPNIFDLAQLGTSVDKLIGISFKEAKVAVVVRLLDGSQTNREPRGGNQRMPSDTYRWANTRSVTLRSLCELRSGVDQFLCAPRRALGAPPGSSGEGSCKLKRLTLCNQGH